MSDTEKFHHLMKALEEPAARVLSGWQIIGENYQPSYETLTKAYENKYRMIMAYLDDWHKTPKFTQETYENLRVMIDNTNKATRQLKVAGSPVDTWDHILGYGIIARMPPRTLSAWETAHESKEMPTLKVILEFLEKRARGQLN